MKTPFSRTNRKESDRRNVKLNSKFVTRKCNWSYLLRIWEWAGIEMVQKFMEKFLRLRHNSWLSFCNTTGRWWPRFESKFHKNQSSFRMNGQFAGKEIAKCCGTRPSQCTRWRFPITKRQGSHVGCNCKCFARHCLSLSHFPSFAQQYNAFRFLHFSKCFFFSLSLSRFFSCYLNDKLQSLSLNFIKL